MDLSDQVVEVAQQYQPHQVRFALSNEDEYIDELRALGLADAYEDVKVGRCPLFGREFFFCFFFLKFPFERWRTRVFRGTSRRNGVLFVALFFCFQPFSISLFFNDDWIERWRFVFVFHLISIDYFLLVLKKGGRLHQGHEIPHGPRGRFQRPPFAGIPRPTQRRLVYRVFFTGFYRVLQGFTGFYLVLSSFT